MSFTQNLLFTVAMALVALAIMVGVALHGKAFERRLSRAYWWGFLVGWGLFVIGMELSIVYSNLDVSDWTRARPLGWASPPPWLWPPRAVSWRATSSGALPTRPPSQERPRPGCG